MNSLPFALSILSAMITPAVLLAACGTLILSTVNRTIRVVDQAHVLSDRFETLAKNQADLATNSLAQERFITIFEQLYKMTERARLLQRALAVFYLALSIFAATSVAIGAVGVLGFHLAWIPLFLTFVGIGLFFYSCILLILESRLALFTTFSEMDFIRRMGKQYASPELFEKSQRRAKQFKW